MTFLSSAGSRVVIVATATHQDGTMLPDVPSAATSAERLGELLVERCGLDPDSLTVLHDPPTPQDFATVIAANAELADDTLLVYYIGHGLLSPSGELHLAVHRTTSLRPGTVAAYEALPYSAVSDVLVTSPARAVVVVLDCCFSGRAGMPRRRDCLVIASAGGEEVALAPAGAELTTFTGALIGYLERGDPTGSPVLTIGQVARLLRFGHELAGYPMPRVLGTGTLDDLVLVPNAAHQVIEPPAALPERPDRSRSPYRGLATYGTEDAGVFFGRQELTATIVAMVAARVYRRRPLLVVGASGSGKSSVLRAGLLAAVQRGELGIARSSGWPQVILTPGPHPLAALAGRLALLLEETPERVEQLLRSSPERVAEQLRARPAPSPARVLLVVDQLEDLFTRCRQAAERVAFLAALAAISGPPDGGEDPPVLAVLAVRADFYGRCAAYPWLAEALRDSQVLVGPMTRGELREVIEEPAAAAGLRLEAGLSEVLLRDAGAVGADEDSGREAGVLPLLSHALLATWRVRRSGQLTVEGYQAVGGIGGAISQTAEGLYRSLPASVRPALRQLMLRLVAVNDDTPPSRSRVPLSQIRQKNLLAKLVRLRLVTTSEQNVELAHEAIIREWARLSGWIRDEATDLAAQRKLAVAAKSWDGDGRHAAGLYRGPRLDAVRRWHAEPALRRRLGAMEQEFLFASIRHDRQRVRRSYLYVAALGAAVMLLAGAAIFALAQRRTAQAEQIRATVQALISEQSRLRGAESAGALAAGVAAVRLGGGTQARDALRATLSQPHLAARTDENLEAYDPATATALTGSDESPLWNFRDPGHPQSMPGARCAAAGASDGAAIGPGAGLVAYLESVPSENGEFDLTICDLHNQDTWRASRIKGTEETRPFAFAGNTVVFSPDGRRLAAAGRYGGGLTVVDVTRRTSAELAPPGGGMFAGAAFSSDGSLLAAVVDHAETFQVVDDADLVVYDLTGARPDLVADVPLTNPGRDVGAYAVTFRPMSRAVAVGVDNAVQLFDLAKPDRPVRLATLSGAAQTFSTVAFSKDGLTLAGGTDSGETLLWRVHDLSAATLLGTVQAHGTVHTLAFAADNRTVVVGAMDTTWWDPGAPNLAAHLVQPGGHGSAPAFSADSAKVAAADRAGAVTVWGAADGRPAGTAKTGVATALAVAFSRDGRRIVVAGEGAELWDISSPHAGKRLYAWNDDGAGSADFPYAAFSPRGDLLALESGAGQIVLWEVSASGAPNRLATLTGPPYTGLVTFTGDGRTLIGLAEGSVTTWDVQDPAKPQSERVVELHSDVAYHSSVINTGLAATSDGNTVAASFPNSRTQLWSIADGHEARPTATLDIDAAASSTLFTTDGSVFVQASADTAITMWDVRNPAGATKLISFDTPNPAEGLALSPDGHTLAEADRTGIWLWNTETFLRAMADPVAVACDAIDRLSPATETWWSDRWGIPSPALCP